jgi:hypothetical protein
MEMQDIYANTIENASLKSKLLKAVNNMYWFLSNGNKLISFLVLLFCDYIGAYIIRMFIFHGKFCKKKL